MPFERRLADEAADLLASLGYGHVAREVQVGAGRKASAEPTWWLGAPMSPAPSHRLCSSKSRVPSVSHPPGECSLSLPHTRTS